ncbi:10870_t:CDS:1, partial [Gigaspora rosea]
SIAVYDISEILNRKKDEFQYNYSEQFSDYNKTIQGDGQTMKDLTEECVVEKFDKCDQKMTLKQEMFLKC